MYVLPVVSELSFSTVSAAAEVSLIDSMDTIRSKAATIAAIVHNISVCFLSAPFIFIFYSPYRRHSVCIIAEYVRFELI